MISLRPLKVFPDQRVMPLRCAPGYRSKARPAYSKDLSYNEPSWACHSRPRCLLFVLCLPYLPCWPMLYSSHLLSARPPNRQCWVSGHIAFEDFCLGRAWAPQGPKITHRRLTSGRIFGNQASRGLTDCRHVGLCLALSTKNINVSVYIRI